MKNPNSIFVSISHCTASGWDGVHFLQSSPESAAFLICAENSPDNTPVLQLLVNGACTVPRLSLLLLLPVPSKSVGSGWASGWEGTQRAQLTPAGQGDAPRCSAGTVPGGRQKEQLALGHLCSQGKVCWGPASWGGAGHLLVQGNPLSCFACTCSFCFAA